jgi:hypothetical protein
MAPNATGDAAGSSSSRAQCVIATSPGRLWARGRSMEFRPIARREGWTHGLHLRLPNAPSPRASNQHQTALPGRTRHRLLGHKRNAPVRAVVQVPAAIFCSTSSPLRTQGPRMAGMDRGARTPPPHRLRLGRGAPARAGSLAGQAGPPAAAATAGTSSSCSAALGGRVGGHSGDGVNPRPPRRVGDLECAAARPRSYAPGRRSSSATSCSVSGSGSTSSSASRRASSR